jgi:formylglycine-generating enzyme required for sulfatase activity
MTTSTVPQAGDFPVFTQTQPGPLPSDGKRTEGFRLAVVPTTVRQYWRYLVDHGLHESPDPRLHGFPTEEGTGLRITPTGVAIDEHLAALPVTGVTWHGALAYCAWLSARLGTPCRLPTAAEWHYAAAGPAGLRWSLGDEFDRQTYAPPAATGPRRVGGSPASAFGLHDMTGNVFEWCADALSAPGLPEGTTLGSRVIKGGAYTMRNPESFENATIFTADELSAVPYIGFRVLMINSTGQPDRGTDLLGQGAPAGPFAEMGDR